MDIQPPLIEINSVYFSERRLELKFAYALKTVTPFMCVLLGTFVIVLLRSVTGLLWIDVDAKAVDVALIELWF